MSEHPSLRERLRALWKRCNEPMFEPSEDQTLVAFAELFERSGLHAFDADKHLRTDAFSAIYDCETESRADADAEPEKFVVTWAPVWQRDEPVTGFRTGRDSVLLGSTPTVAMPQDERTSALLLLVTTPFVHLSAIRADTGPLIRGAFAGEDGEFHFLVLGPVAFMPAEAAEETAATAPAPPVSID